MLKNIRLSYFTSFLTLHILLNYWMLVISNDLGIIIFKQLIVLYGKKMWNLENYNS